MCDDTARDAQAWAFVVDNWHTLVRFCAQRCRGRYDLVDEMMSDVVVMRMPDIFRTYEEWRETPIEVHVFANLKWYVYKYLNAGGRRSTRETTNSVSLIGDEDDTRASHSPGLGEPSYEVDLETRMWVLDIISSLPETQGRLLFLRDVCQMTFLEVGAVMGYGKSTARLRYDEALCLARELTRE